MVELYFQHLEHLFRYHVMALFGDALRALSAKRDEHPATRAELTKRFYATPAELSHELGPGPDEEVETQGAGVQGHAGHKVAIMLLMVIAAS